MARTDLNFVFILVLSNMLRFVFAFHFMFGLFCLRCNLVFARPLHNTVSVIEQAVPLQLKLSFDYLSELAAFGVNVVL